MVITTATIPHRLSTLFLVVPFLLILFVSFASAETSTVGNAADKTRSITELKVAASDNFPPVNLLDERGNLTGFGRDMSEAVAREMGVPVSYIHSPYWTEVLSWLESGQADLIHDAAYTEERAKHLDYSDPILEMEERIFVQKGRIGIVDFASLKGRKVACVEEHITHLYLKNFPEINCMLVKTPTEGLLLLSIGHVDAFVYPAPIIDYLSQELGLIGDIEAVGMPLRTLQWSMVVRKGDSELLSFLNEGIREVRESGQYDRIYDKWFGKKLFSSYSKKERDIINKAVIALAVLAAFVLVLLFFNSRLIRTRAELREKGEYLRTIWDTVQSGIMLIDPEDHRIVDINAAGAELAGTSKEELIGQQCHQYMCPAARGRCPITDLGEGVDRSERRLLTAAGRSLEILKTVRPIAIAGKKYLIETFMDISELKKVGENLRKSNEFLENVFSTGTVLIAYMDSGFNFIRVNNKYAEADGRTPEFFVGKNHFELYPDEENKAIFTRVVETGEPVSYFAKRFTYHEHPERGTTYWDWSLHPVKNALGKVDALVFFLVDVTERFKAQEAMRESERKYRDLFENANDAIFILDMNQIFIDANKKAEEMFGFTRDEFLKMRVYDLIPEEQAPQSAAEFDKLKASGGYEGFTGKAKTKDRRVIDVEVSSSAIYEGGKFAGSRDIVRDITKRKKSEEALMAANRALATIGGCNEALVHATEENDLLHKICRIIVERGGYRMSWVGFAQDDEEKTVRPMAHCGFEESYLVTTNITWADTESGRGPTGTSIRTGEISVCQDIHNDPQYAPWREKARERGYQSSAAFPLKADSKVFGALNIYSEEPHAFGGEELNLLSGLAEDLSFGIMALRTRKERELAEAHIKRQLERMTALHNIDTTISGSLDLRVTLHVVLDEVLTHLTVDAARVMHLNPHSQMLEYMSGRGFSTEEAKRCTFRLGEGYSGKVALERKPLIIPDLYKEETIFCAKVVEKEAFAAYFGIPLIAKGKVSGVLELYHRSPFDPDDEWLNFLNILAGQAAIAIENAAMFTDLQRSRDELFLAYDKTIEGWSRALDYRDKETEGHSQRVTEMTMQIAREMGFSEEDLVHVRRGALLHDIGKIGVPDAILFKPGTLDEEEWKVMKRHPALAYELLSPIDFLRPSIDVPYCHHEKWDGSGYPRGLKGEQIPLAARIFAVVDVWDALSSDRPYRPAWPREKIVEYMKDISGKHFDPDVVDIFFKMEW